MSKIPSSLQKELMEWLSNSTTNDKSQKQSKEDRVKQEPVEKIIHRIATENRKLFFDRNKNAYVEVQDEKQLQAINKYLVKVNSEEFNEWVTHQCFTNYYKTPSNQQLKGLKRVVSREAQLNGEKIELYNRVASIDDAIYIDLGTTDRKMVKVHGRGVEVGNYQVYFQRHLHMEELPEPVMGGDFKELLYYFPPLSDHDQCLVLCWLVASFIEHIQRPFLLIEGAAGGGKTTLGLLLKSFIDPMENAALSYNENENEVAQIIDHQFIPFFDNLTSISKKLSNLMCRAYSGGSHLKKELYTDDKDFILKLSGNIIISAINLIKPQNDFLQRCFKIVIKKTNDSNRSREQFAKQFEAAKPRIFGALLETLSKTLAIVEKTPFNNSFRTGDFDRYAATVSVVLGYGRDFFYEARSKSEQLKKADMINNTPIINGINKVLEQNGGEFIGYMTKLLGLLKADKEIASDIPSHANVLSMRISQLIPELNAAGILAEKNKSNDGRGMPWTFRLVGKKQENVPATNVSQPGSVNYQAGNKPSTDEKVETSINQQEQPLLPINPFLLEDDDLNSLQNSGEVDTAPLTGSEIDRILNGTS